MGYKIQVVAKEERKNGFAALDKLLNDPSWPKDKILATAKLNIKLFEQWDELPDAEFCKTMKVLRENNPDIYGVFWWWRKALEDHVKTGNEEDGFQIKETRYRCFSITQFLSRPFSDDWENDRVTLKSGACPLITEEKIKEGLDHKVIKKFAYICHNKDIYTEEDEIADVRGLIKTGDRKFAHWHIVIDVPSKVPVSTIARWFDVPPNMIKIVRGKGAFLDAVEYLPHESPKSIEQGKTHYDYDEIVVSPGFDLPKELKDLQEHRARYGKRAGEMTSADTMRLHVMEDGWSLRDCRRDDPLTYSRIRSTLPQLRLDYLLDAPPCPFRITIYVEGEGGIGKSSFCRYMAEEMAKDFDNPYFPIGNDHRVTFDGYDGEPVIIFNDMRASDFISRFGSSGTYKILDSHPDKEAQQAKNSRVVLTNYINIINGVEPYQDFIDGLIATYVDIDGNVKREDETQAWRRFPIIICVRENDFDILLNTGFFNRDLRSVKTMVMYANVCGSVAKVSQSLDGVAKKTVINHVTKPVIELVDRIKEKEGDKISDPADLPEEFNTYGTVKYGYEIEAERRAAEKERLLKEKEKELQRLKKMQEKLVSDKDRILPLFGAWFWFTDGPTAPVCCPYTFAGACEVDRLVYEEPKKEWELAYSGVTDEQLLWLAKQFETDAVIRSNFVNGALTCRSAVELRQAIISEWTGEYPITIEYDIDEDGDVTVTAVDADGTKDRHLLHEISLFSKPSHVKHIKHITMPESAIAKAEKDMTVTVDSEEPFDFLEYISASEEEQTKEEAWLHGDTKE